MIQGSSARGNIFYYLAASKTRERLEHGAALLALIDKLRQESGLPQLGGNFEWSIVRRELAELAEHPAAEMHL